MTDDPAFRPTFLAARVGKEHHPDAHEKEETRGTEVGHQSGEKSERCGEGGHRPSPMLPTGMLLCDEVVGMIERHEDDD